MNYKIVKVAEDGRLFSAFIQYKSHMVEYFVNEWVKPKTSNSLYGLFYCTDDDIVKGVESSIGGVVIHDDFLFHKGSKEKFAIYTCEVEPCVLEYFFPELFYIVEDNVIERLSFRKPHFPLANQIKLIIQLSSVELHALLNKDE